MKIIKKIKLLLLLLTLIIPVGLYAQGPDFDEDVVDDVPIDGGVSLLVAAGVGYGIKRLKASRDKNNDVHK